MSEILPCPYCGTEPHMDGAGEKHWVECNSPKCWANGPMRGSPSAAIAAWNTRADRTEIERLEERYAGAASEVHAWHEATVREKARAEAAESQRDALSAKVETMGKVLEDIRADLGAARQTNTLNRRWHPYIDRIDAALSAESGAEPQETDHG